MENTILFDKYKEVFKEDNTIPSLLDTNSDLLIDIFKGFKYPISSWPVIINNKMKEELKEASIKIPKLLQKIPSLYFENDVKRIADFYFNGDQTIGQFSLMCQNKNLDVSSRLDLTYTNDGFKVLEINMGSSIGGMEFQNFEPLIKELHPILSTNKEQFDSKKTQSLYIKFLINKIEAHVSSQDNELGIFLVNTSLGDAASKNMIKSFFDQLLEKELTHKNKKGSTYIDSISELKFTNNTLQYQNKKIHAVLILDYALNNITPDVFRALVTDQVYFPDHLGTAFMRDKRNLALLRRLAVAEKFSEDDNKTILKYIPWTELVVNEQVKYQGEFYTVPELLAKKQEQFVIKIADGLQGKDVFIGKFCKQEEWAKIIEKALQEKTYVAQEFSESIDLLAPNKANNWEPHKLVWGAFGFGDIYGGVWVRMSANNTDAGVINSANGAVEGIVYESY
ncbi:hypothetical protein IMCC3317_07780 [Kordia antarctica]|uniref:Glutathionylspermidine synthase pre-ATP-grasp-like domain-containing protein n=1 Tax=Kordia antarctica TaxID=1218801 RepID=A0A7L4ZFI3_9FLAO|nr:hypothetical protein [Kordia antarctica]QHI35432.1 hypothetical protein IMCC3317_07780 [Kordia antarctica]